MDLQCSSQLLGTIALILHSALTWGFCLRFNSFKIDFWTLLYATNCCWLVPTFSFAYQDFWLRSARITGSSDGRSQGWDQATCQTCPWIVLWYQGKLCSWSYRIQIRVCGLPFGQGTSSPPWDLDFQFPSQSDQVKVLSSLSAWSLDIRNSSWECCCSCRLKTWLSHLLDYQSA